MSKGNALLINNSFRKWGYLSVLIGLAFSYVNSFTQIRIESPVLAIYSGFMEQSYFKLTQTNLADELAMIFLFLGILILIIAKEKNESDQLNALRNKALILSFIINNLLLMFCVLFIYGTGFIGVLIAGLYSQSIIYLIIFSILKYKNKT